MRERGKEQFYSLWVYILGKTFLQFCTFSSDFTFKLSQNKIISMQFEVVLKIIN